MGKELEETLHKSCTNGQQLKRTRLTPPVTGETSYRRRAVLEHGHWRASPERAQCCPGRGAAETLLRERSDGAAVLGKQHDGL